MMKNAELLRFEIAEEYKKKYQLLDDFEDMMSRFKSQSEEKMADLDHETNNRRGGGYAPRSRRGR